VVIQDKGFYNDVMMINTEAKMHSLSNFNQLDDYKRVEKAIQYLEVNFKSQPTLAQIAESVHLSKYHFNRIFKRWAGISPIQFQQYLTLDYSKQKLADSSSLLDTSLDAGLSGSSRLHDLFVTFEAMTPGEFKKQGAGLTITYGFCETPFGDCLLAITERGICHLGFVKDDNRLEALNQLYDTWPGAMYREETMAIRTMVKKIFEINRTKNAQPFNILVKGTNFQINVWKALLNIPEGWIVSYQDIAAYIGHPKAFRAVANAIAINPVAYLIPCHRVIAKSGKIHKYRWGSARKKAIIGWEAAKSA
jgi:AraC family transcriptional regulator of adaptative response/methylated-DNA-[protein]-cysteine methyltransferase